MTASHLPDDWWPDPVPDNVFVGERCYLYSSFAFTRYRSERPVGVRIGNDSGIYEGTVFDLGPEGEVEIGDYATVVAPVICTNGRVTIGDYAFISHDVFIADRFDAVPPDDIDACGGWQEERSHIAIGENAWVGTRAVLLKGTRLGRGAIVGAGCVVDFPIGNYEIVAGNPARVVGTSPPRRAT